MRSERSPCTIRRPAGLQERTALVGLLAADVVAPDGGPVEGRADLWADVSTRLREIAVADGDLGTAHQWAARVLAHERDTGTPSAIAVALVTLATVEIKLNDPACVGHLTEAGRLMNGVEHPDQLLAAMHYHLGMAYQDVDAIHDLNRAYAEYGKSEELQHPNNRTNQAKCVSQRAQILVEAGRDDPEHAAAYLAEAMRDTVTALQLFAPDDAANQAIVHARIGQIYRISGRWSDALGYDTAARALSEAAGDVFGQATGRLNVALDLHGLGRPDDGRVYAAAAAQAFAALGERGRAGADLARQLLAELDS